MEQYICSTLYLGALFYIRTFWIEKSPPPPTCMEHNIIMWGWKTNGHMDHKKNLHCHIDFNCLECRLRSPFLLYPQVHCYLPRFIHSELNHRNPHIWLPFSKHGNGQFPINHRPPPWNRRISPAMSMGGPPAVPGGPLWRRGEWFDTPHGRCSSPTTSATRARASGSMCRCYSEN